MRIAKTLNDYAERKRLRTLAAGSGVQPVYFIVVEPRTLLISRDSYRAITGAIAQSMRLRHKRRFLEKSGIHVFGELGRGRLDALHNDLILLQMRQFHCRVRSGRVWMNLPHPEEGRIHGVSLWMMAQLHEPLETVNLVVKALSLRPDVAVYWEALDSMEPHKLRLNHEA